MAPILKSKKFILRAPKSGDAVSLARNINNPKIARQTLRIPHPYELRDAQKWIRHTLQQGKKKKINNIRWVMVINREVVGGIGLSDITGKSAEVGYWLAEQYWGQGLTTRALKLVTQYGFRQLKLKRIYGFIFVQNRASARVLEKCGFKFECRLKKHVVKNGQRVDDLMYAKVK